MTTLTRAQILSREDIGPQAKASLAAMLETVDQLCTAYQSGQSPDVLRVIARLASTLADELSVEVAPLPVFLTRVAS